MSCVIKKYYLAHICFCDLVYFSVYCPRGLYNAAYLVIINLFKNSVFKYIVGFFPYYYFPDAIYYEPQDSTKQTSAKTLLSC